ncbi:ATP synthase-coupling factor 6, mitochondrial [Schistocerca gregaria]|uniref:ATP synthase-coupling factor 6, mitochondrial n=1 Tax=Schistocerca gregaria TaxID=7010 RepID=UPI00211DFF35|nr:ATP synthase-coupling factor 6, mitochondrial [Schistocerca gregaria]
MLTSHFLQRSKKAVPLLLRRNFGIVAPALQKATDPIQQLFIDKVRDYAKRSQAAGGKLVDMTPEIEREWKAELEKVAKQFGGKPGEDMTKFPTFKFTDPKIDPINMS